MLQDIIWITGASGRLGSTLSRLLDPLEAEIIATDKEDVDITNQKEVNSFVDRNRPKIIINCSGLSDRDKCQEDPDRAFLLNAIGAKYVAIAAARVKAKLIHLSTADVFNGQTSHPYREIDIVSPNTVYGQSKYLGEQMVKDFCQRYFIVRVSRLYSRENRFVENIIESAKKDGKIEVPKAQYASPTSVYELVQFLVKLMSTSAYGLYHASCEGQCSMKEFAEKILEIANLKADIIYSDNRQSVNNQPAYRAIENYLLKVTKIHQFADWQEALKNYMKRELNYGN